MSSIIRNFNAFFACSKEKARIRDSRQSSQFALSSPVVVGKVLEYVPYWELRKLRLVNRTWNREATHRLQQQEHSITLTVPFNATTQKFVLLIDEVLALEKETYNEWRWSFSKVELVNCYSSSKLLNFREVEKLLCAVSKQITSLKLTKFRISKITDFPECPPVLQFSCLRILSGQFNEQLANWLLKQSPRLRILDFCTKPLSFEKYCKFHLRSLCVYQPDISKECLTSLAAFVSHQTSLRIFRISPSYWSTCEFATCFSISLPNLVDLEIGTNAAAILFGPPNKLPSVQILKVHLDKPNPESWLSKWNGRELRTVTNFSLCSNPFKLDCVPLQVVHDICKIFPNLKVLHLSLRFTNYPKKICLDMCVPYLKKITELYVKLGGMWQLSPKLRDTNSALEEVEILILEYPKGCLTIQHCKNIFLSGMPKLKQLRLMSNEDTGACIHGMLGQIRDLFSVTFSIIDPSDFVVFNYDDGTESNSDEKSEDYTKDDDSSDDDPPENDTVNVDIDWVTGLLIWYGKHSLLTSFVLLTACVFYVERNSLFYGHWQNCATFAVYVAICLVAIYFLEKIFKE